MAFLYDEHRLNVAVSRAMGLAIVVASPDLLLVAPHGPAEMRKANAVCRLVEVAAEQAARAHASPVMAPVGGRPLAAAERDDLAVEVLTLGLT
jgi:hypothetical protein